MGDNWLSFSPNTLQKRRIKLYVQCSKSKRTLNDHSITPSHLNYRDIDQLWCKWKWHHVQWRGPTDSSIVLCSACVLVTTGSMRRYLQSNQVAQVVQLLQDGTSILAVIRRLEVSPSKFLTRKAVRRACHGASEEVSLISQWHVMSSYLLESDRSQYWWMATERSTFESWNCL